MKDRVWEFGQRAGNYKKRYSTCVCVGGWEQQIQSFQMKNTITEIKNSMDRLIAPKTQKKKNLWTKISEENIWNKVSRDKRWENM